MVSSSSKSQRTGGGTRRRTTRNTGGTAVRVAGKSGRVTVGGGSVGLKSAVEAHDIVWALQKHGVTQRTIAVVTATDARSVYEWKQGATPRRQRYDRLAGLRDVVTTLSDSLTKTGVSQWLEARNRYLDGARPIDALSEGRLDDVLEAARAYAEGVYL